MTQPGIGGLEFDPANKTLYVAAKNGLHRSVDGAPFAKFSNLGQAQCVTKRGAALASTTAAQRRLAFVTLTIRQEVTAAFTQYDAAQRALEIYTQGVQEVARQNLEVVRQTYTLGRATLLDVIAEQRRYIDVETGYTDVLKQVYDAAVDIERAVGTLER